MAINPAELIAWLPKEDQDAVMALFGKHPDAATKLETVFNSTVESQMSPLRAELETRRRDLDAQFETIDSIRGADGRLLDSVRGDAEKNASALAVAQTRIKTVCAEAGIDPEPYLKDLVAAQPAARTETSKVADTTFDPNKFRTEAGTMAFNALTASLEAQDIAQEHIKLFGEPLTNATGLLRELQERVRRTGNQSIGLRDVWADTYKVDAKRTEIAEQSVQRRIHDAVEKAKIEMADKQALTISDSRPADFVGSPLLATLQPKDRPAQNAGIPEGVLASMAAFNKRSTVAA